MVAWEADRPVEGENGVRSEAGAGAQQRNARIQLLFDPCGTVEKQPEGI
jgi:hypothetical protein